RLGLLAALAAGPVFVLLVNRLFDLRPGRWTRGAVAVMLASLPVAALLPLGLLARFSDVISMGVFLGLVAVVGRAVSGRSPHAPNARTLAVGTAAFSACVSWDLLNEYGLTPVARVLPGVPGLFWIGFLVFAVTVGVVTAGKWAQAEVDALTDPLTGLSRRHVFEDALRREAARMRRSGGSLALVMIDLDHFKRINDTYGHRMGDEVLARVGRLLRHSARNIDLAARLGGEEFGVLLFDTREEGATVFVDRFRDHLRGLSLPASAGTVRVTASAGIAVASDLVDADALLDAADAAMYRAKEEGRDRAVTARLGESVGVV
ncbi:MAG TPA: GGDEF domain-containing protein, partial [Longimicrobiaceae bacterium]